MLDWKAEKRALRKLVKEHQKKHLKLMKRKLREYKLTGVVVKKNDGRSGLILPDVKPHPDIYEPYEFVFFPFGPTGENVENEGVRVDESDLTKLFEKKKRSKNEI